MHACMYGCMSSIHSHSCHMHIPGLAHAQRKAVHATHLNSNVASRGQHGLCNLDLAIGMHEPGHTRIRPVQFHYHVGQMLCHWHDGRHDDAFNMDSLANSPKFAY